MKKLEDIKAEIGKILYNRWRDEGRHAYELKEKHDLNLREYLNMYVQWKYSIHKRAEENLRTNWGICWYDNEGEGYTPIR